MTTDTPRRAAQAAGWLGLFVALLLTAWAYRPALDAAFVFDDEPNIVDSPAVHWSEVSWSNIELLLDSSRLQYRPVSNLSFALDHVAGGLEPRRYHVTNLLIHLAVGAALIWLCLLYARNAAIGGQEALTERTPSGLIALPVGLFLLHPLNTQAVSYVVQRMTALAALFALLAFACYLAGRYKTTRRSNWWFMAALGLWLLAVGSKENALLLAPVVVTFEICFFRREWRERIERRLGGSWNRRWTLLATVGAVVLAVLALWLITISSASVSLSGQLSGRDFSGFERMLTQTRVQLLYLSLLLWPSPERLNLDYDFAISTSLLSPATTIVAVTVCLAAVIGAIYLAARRPRYGFPLLAYIIFHAIEAGPVSLELVYEHRMYLPVCMLILGGAAFLADLSTRQAIAALAAILLLFAPLANWTHARNQVWGDSLALQADIAAKSPNKSRAQHNYALALLEAGQGPDALATVRRAISLDPGDTRPRRLEAEILLALGRAEDSIAAYKTAIQMDPASVASTLGLGAALQASGQEEAAYWHYLDTGSRFGQSGLAWRAIPLLQEAVKLRPDDPAALSALGSAYLVAGLHNDALQHFRAALDRDPENIEAWYNRGLAAEALGNRDEAIAAYKSFVERAPMSLQQAVLYARGRIAALESVTTE